MASNDWIVMSNIWKRGLYWPKLIYYPEIGE
jgi:hypothetical protein